VNSSADDTAVHAGPAQTFKDPDGRLSPPRKPQRPRFAADGICRPCSLSVDPLGERFSGKEDRTLDLVSARFRQAQPDQTWSWRRDLNPRPSDYKSDALPAELRQPTKAASSHTATAALRKLNRRLGLQSEDSTPPCLMTNSHEQRRAFRFPIPAPGAAPQDSKPHWMLSFGTTYEFIKHFQ
jgi:hypothetical protein